VESGFPRDHAPTRYHRFNPKRSRLIDKSDAMERLRECVPNFRRGKRSLIIAEALHLQLNALAWPKVPSG
jgi:hypothetical protein